MIKRLTLLSLFLFLILIAYICMHMPRPVFGEVVFPYEVGKGVYRFAVQHEPVLLRLGVRMPKGELRQDRAFNLTIIDEQVKNTILKRQINISKLKKMSNTDMNADIYYNYYSVINIQNIGILKNSSYVVRIKGEDGNLEEFKFVVFIRGLFR